MEKANFRESDHTYWLDEKQLISVTQLLKKHGLSNDYSFVDKDILNKSAERGKLIHKEIESYIKNGEKGFTTELEDFINLSEEIGLKALKSEEIVNNELVAGTVDYQGTRMIQELPCNDYRQIKVIADYKTGVTINKEACRWQLSLYERLSGEKFDEFYIFHLGENSKAIQVERISSQEVDKLLECEAKGIIYQKKELELPNRLIAEVQAVEQLIKDIDARKKEAEANAETLKSKLLEAMASQGIKSYETMDNAMLITYIEPSIRESIDSAKLKKEMPDIAKRFLKTSNVKASVRITLRA